MEKKGNQEPWFERLKEEHQDLTECLTYGSILVCTKKR